MNNEVLAQPIAKVNKKVILGCGIFLGVVIIGLIAGVASCIIYANSAYKFEVIGAEGNNYFVHLSFPSVDKIDNQKLAEQLKLQWNIKGIANVMVFDNQEAPKEWLSIWHRLNKMPESEWMLERSIIYPHYIASYRLNKNTGYEAVQVYARDTEATIVQTIDLK